MDLEYKAKLLGFIDVSQDDLEKYDMVEDFLGLVPEGKLDHDRQRVCAVINELGDQLLSNKMHVNENNYEVQKRTVSNMLLNIVVRTRMQTVYTLFNDIDEFCAHMGKVQPDLVDYLRNHDEVKSRFENT